MEHKNISLIDVVESFLTGICCLVGGDQLYLFISQTNASPKTLYYLSISLVIGTLILAFIFYDEYYPQVIHGFHVLYTFLLFFVVLILYCRIRSKTIVTLYTVILSIVLTIFVLFCCISYSTNKYLLMTFITGMLSSRLVPSFCWLFIENKYYDQNYYVMLLAIRVGFIRILFCIIPIVIKIFNKKFHLKFKLKISKPQIDLTVLRKESFAEMCKYFLETFNLKSISISSTKGKILSFSTKIPIVIFPFISLYMAILLFLSLSPILHRPISKKLYFNYSYNIISSLSIIEMIFYLFGSLIGITYPASNTANSPNFYLFNLFVYCSYTIIFTYLSYLGKSFTDLYLNFIVICTSFLLGYHFSYSFMIIINTTIGQTCIYDERGFFPSCCGDKINKRCYCKLPSIIRNIYKNDIDVRFECSKSFGQRRTFLYSPEAKSAILILDCSISECKDIKCCTDVCKTHCIGDQCKCLKLLGLYKIHSVTGTTCSDCQLTVRIEGKKMCCKDDCPGTGGLECCCTDSTSKCCCLAVGCCDTGGSRCICSGCTPDNCCCVKMCCCTDCNNGCKCKDTKSSVRLFVAYKNCKMKCCIKEIKPNYETVFQSDINEQNEFYIKSIFFSDCCHVDLQIDLHCYMKNSFYRLTCINYPKKYLRPNAFLLNKKSDVCCNAGKHSQCCCNIPLVRICVIYKYTNECKHCCNKKPCGCKCSCCGSSCETSCCCCATVRLNNLPLTSFNKKIYNVRVKLIIILLLIFIILWAISTSIVIKTKDKRLRFYDYNTIKEFKSLSKLGRNLKINTIKEVSKRLNNTEKSQTSSSNEVVDKSKDLKNMMKLFEEVLDEKEFIKLNKYVDENTNKHIKKSKTKQDISKDDIMWSYCIGLMYSYVIEMYLKLQTYFIRWEFVWRREYYNYLKSIDSTFNNITNKSKCGISIISELNLKEKTPYCLTKKRTISFNNTYDELNRYIDINENETKCNQELPNDINCRLIYFIDRWDHRINIIKNWINNESNLFNWDQFIEQYPYIQKWYDTFHRYLERASNEVQIPENKLNNNVPLTMFNSI